MMFEPQRRVQNDFVSNDNRLNRNENELSLDERETELFAFGTIISVDGEHRLSDIINAYVTEYSDDDFRKGRNMSRLARNIIQTIFLRRDDNNKYFTFIVYLFRRLLLLLLPESEGPKIKIATLVMLYHIKSIQTKNARIHHL